ncbi:MAG: chorismate mutase [Rhodobacteraceae bacterium]|nr:chorismate mutase [Paracoccaceae bacterium]
MTDPAQCRDMTDLRQLIDGLDRDLVRLLALRQRCIDRAAELKRHEDLPARIPARVEEVVANIRSAARAEGADADLLETLWRQLIDWSIAREDMQLRAPE